MIQQFEEYKTFTVIYNILRSSHGGAFGSSFDLIHGINFSLFQSNPSNTQSSKSKMCRLYFAAGYSYSYLELCFSQKLAPKSFRAGLRFLDAVAWKGGLGLPYINSH